jgi:hypothetical protein
MKRRRDNGLSKLKLGGLKEYVVHDPKIGVIRLLIGAVFVAAVLGSAGPLPGVPTPSVTAGPSDSEILADLRAEIKGRGKEPAEAVYKNIQILKGKPAGAVLSIMEIGYNTSLGVKCDYCHDPKDWSSDSKKQKGIARQMSGMVHDINEKYLKSIEGLKSDKAVVNCTTCHRGQEKPALDLEPAPVLKK